MQELTRKFTHEEADNIGKWLWNWLSEYVQSVSDDIFENEIDEIVNNTVTLEMLKKLYEYETANRDRAADKISSALDYCSHDNDYENIWADNLKNLHEKLYFKDPTPYRRVLYDLYIKDRP